MSRNQQIQNFIAALEAADGVSVDAGITDGAVQITDDEGDTLHITRGGRMLVSVPGVVETTTPSTTTGSTYGVQSVDAAGSIVLAANESRESLLVQNKGAESVFVGFDNTVTPTTGVEVAAGGTYSDDTYTGPVYAITGGGSVDVAFQDVATE